MPIIENITERNIMMKARTSLWASLAIAASLGLAGCGGSSDTKTNTEDDMMTNTGGMTTPAALPTGSLDLPTGHNLTVPDQGTETEFTVPANGMRTLGNVTFECKSSRACTVTVRNLLGQADATRVGDVEAALVAATDGGGATTPTPGAGGTGTGSNAFLSRAMLLEAVQYDGTAFSSDGGVGSSFTAGSPVDALGSTSFRGIEFTRGNPTSDDVVHIRSDIGAPAVPDDETFSSLYGELDDDDENDVSSADTDDFWSLITGSNLGGTGSSTNKRITSATYLQGEAIPSVMFGAGTTRITGTLTCESGTCVITSRGGELSAPGEWTFEVTTDADISVPDSDYLVFGYWKQTPETQPDARPTVLEAFYAGAAPFEADGIVKLEGGATYVGAAAGRYAYRPASGTLTRGDFADANVVTLTANFGTDVQAGMISGTITGISAGITSVSLPRTSIAGTGTFSGGKPTGYTGGSWSGQFFGNDRGDGDPGSAAGKFEGWKGTSSGTKEYISLEGSFGAIHDNN